MFVIPKGYFMHCSAASVTFELSEDTIQLLFVALRIDKNRMLRYLGSKLHAKCRLSHFT